MTYKLSELNIYEIENTLKSYLLEKHPKESNGFLIRLSNTLNNNFERRRSYIIAYPIETKIDEIIDSWTTYALDNVVEDYDLNMIMNILSIDPLKIRDCNEIKIQYSGTYINPEGIIRNLTFDIIDQMNKHLIELYMDEKYPDIDINDSEFNQIFDELDIEEIYNIYKKTDVYVPIKLSVLEDSKVFYLTGTILTNFKYNDIIDDIRNCLESEDINEILTYDKDEIVYDFNTKNEIEGFNIFVNKN